MSKGDTLEHAVKSVFSSASERATNAAMISLRYATIAMGATALFAADNLLQPNVHSGEGACPIEAVGGNDSWSYEDVA